MGSNNYRGEISHIADDMFINYTLELPDEELASTSGYFMKDAPLRYSSFIVQRGSACHLEQTTDLCAIDRMTGAKTTNKLASVTWSDGSKDICLGMIAGYTLPKEWEAQLEAPYASIYLSMAGAKPNEAGLGHDPTGDKIDIHLNRITAWDSAVLTIPLPLLPEGVALADVQLFIKSHQPEHGHGGGEHEHGSARGEAPATLPDPIPLTTLLNAAGDALVIGTAGQPLQMGLYLLSKRKPPVVEPGEPVIEPVEPVVEPGGGGSEPPPSPYGHHAETV